MNIPTEIINTICEFEPTLIFDIYKKNVKKLPYKFKNFNFLTICIEYSRLDTLDIIKYLLSILKLSESEYEYCYELAINNNNYECVNLIINKININSVNNKNTFLKALYIQNKNIIWNIISNGLIITDEMITIAQICMMTDIEIYLQNKLYEQYFF